MDQGARAPGGIENFIFSLLLSEAGGQLLDLKGLALVLQLKVLEFAID